jgi:hypothetical protein
VVGRSGAGRRGTAIPSDHQEFAYLRPDGHSVFTLRS